MEVLLAAPASSRRGRRPRVFLPGQARRRDEPPGRGPAGAGCWRRPWS